MGLVAFNYNFSKENTKMYSELKQELKRMLLECFSEMKLEKWFGKEREIINRFVFSKLVKNPGCCKEFYDPAQIGIEGRVKQIKEGKNEVCKDLVIWKYPNQNIWSEEKIPICIMEWKHQKRVPSEYDIKWLKAYTAKNIQCFGIVININNNPEYLIKAVLVENGEVINSHWIDFP
jgi:hypothetical protein